MDDRQQPSSDCGERVQREAPLLFKTRAMGTVVGERFKLVLQRGQDPLQAELYDLLADPGEQQDLAEHKPHLVLALLRQFEEWDAGL